MTTQPTTTTTTNNNNNIGPTITTYEPRPMEDEDEEDNNNHFDVFSNEDDDDDEKEKNQENVSTQHKPTINNPTITTMTNEPNPNPNEDGEDNHVDDFSNDDDNENNDKRKGLLLPWVTRDIVDLLPWYWMLKLIGNWWSWRQIHLFHPWIGRRNENLGIGDEMDDTPDVTNSRGLT